MDTCPMLLEQGLKVLEDLAIMSMATLEGLKASLSTRTHHPHHNDAFCLPKSKIQLRVYKTS
jgi:hypothetical protein